MPDHLLVNYRKSLVAICLAQFNNRKGFAGGGQVVPPLCQQSPFVLPSKPLSFLRAFLPTAYPFLLFFPLPPSPPPLLALTALVFTPMCQPLVQLHNSSCRCCCMCDNRDVGMGFSDRNRLFEMYAPGAFCCELGLQGIAISAPRMLETWADSSPGVMCLC